MSSLQCTVHSITKCHQYLGGRRPQATEMQIQELHCELNNMEIMCTAKCVNRQIDCTCYIAQCTVHSAQFTVISALCTSVNSLNTNLQCAKCRVHNSQVTLNSAQCTVHSTLYIVQSAECTNHSSHSKQSTVLRLGADITAECDDVRNTHTHLYFGAGYT